MGRGKLILISISSIATLLLTVITFFVGWDFISGDLKQPDAARENISEVDANDSSEVSVGPGKTNSDSEFGSRRFGFLGAYGQSMAKMSEIWQSEFNLNLVDESSKLVRDLGVGWTRESFSFNLNPNAPGGDSYSASQLSAAKNDGLKIFGTILADPSGYKANEDKYSDWLAETVKNNSNVKYWQLHNEVGKAGRFEKSDDYVEFVKISVPVIRANCADCVIVMGSLFPKKEYYDAVIQKADSYVDAYDIHAFQDEELDIFIDFASKISKPLFITEMSTYSGQPDSKSFAYQPEKEQAEKLIKWHVRAFHSGADYIFWSQFVEWHEFKGKVDGMFDLTGLVYNGLCKSSSVNSVCQDKSIDKGPLTKKEAYSSLKTLIAEIDGFDAVEKIVEGQYKFSVNGKSRYVLWCDADNCALPGEISGTVNVLDYLGNRKSMDTNQIILSENPIFLEV